MKKLDEARINAIAVRDGLSYSDAEGHKHIVKLDRIIRGAVLLKWMHWIAAAVSIFIAVVFTCMMYPDPTGMLLMLGISSMCYVVSYGSVLLQIKLYDRTVSKIKSAVSRNQEMVI